MDRLLSAFGTEYRETTPAPKTATPPPAHLIEPLSEREQEMLGLLVGDLSNRESAEKLVIIVGTAK